MSRSTRSSADGSEHFWPNIKKAILQNPTGQPSNQRMKPQCPVCFETFSITTFRRPSSGNAPSCVVLFCGHVMCRGCLEQAEAGMGDERNCPCCRTALACRCGEASKTFTVPDANTSPDTVFDAPLTKPEDPGRNLQPRCHNCAASGEWLTRIDNGNWPREAETIEPGAVRFIYGTVDALEAEGRPVSPGSVSSAFGSVTNDEFETLMRSRNDFMSQRRTELESTNPWFGGHRETGGRGRYGSSNRHHEHRRETNVDYRAPLDPPLDTEARFRRGEFEERRRIHDRLPEETGLQNQLRNLNLGGQSRFDAFGRPRRGDGRGHAQQRPSFDERGRRDAGMGGMANYGDLRGREAGRDAFSGNPYSGARHGREAGNDTPYGRDTGSRFPDTRRGGDTGRDSRFPGTQRETGRDALSGRRNTGNDAPFRWGDGFLPSRTQGGDDAGRNTNAQRETSPDSFPDTQRGRETTRPRYQDGRDTSKDRAIKARFDSNPEAQRIFREHREMLSSNGILTQDLLDMPSMVRIHREIAVDRADMEARWAREDREDQANNRGDVQRPSERRW